MLYKIRQKTGEAAYLQLYRQIRQDILQGNLEDGVKLPSKREMAEELGISVITVEHAYEMLADEGYVNARPRSGFYVEHRSTFQALSDRKAGQRETDAPMEQSACRYASGDADLLPIQDAPDDFPFSVLAKTMRQVLSIYDRRILAKPPNSGCMELREAIAGYLIRTRDIHVDPRSIIIGSGAEYLYGLIAQLLGPGFTIGLEDPGYQKIRQVYEAYGAECRMLPMGEFGIDSAYLENCMADAIHVTPFRSFPTGITATALKRREYALWARERDGIIIEDDYDSEFAAPGRQIETIFSLSPDRVIYVNTFTRTLAPSMRMGYMVLPEPLLARYRERLDFYSCTVPTYDQYVLAEFIHAGHLERYIRRRRRHQAQNQAQNQNPAQTQTGNHDSGLNTE